MFFTLCLQIYTLGREEGAKHTEKCHEKPEDLGGPPVVCNKNVLAQEIVDYIHNYLGVAIDDHERSADVAASVTTRQWG